MDDSSPCNLFAPFPRPCHGRWRWRWAVAAVAAVAAAGSDSDETPRSRTLSPPSRPHLPPPHAPACPTLTPAQGAIDFWEGWPGKGQGRSGGRRGQGRGGQSSREPNVHWRDVSSFRILSAEPGILTSFPVAGMASRNPAEKRKRCSVNSPV